jgi:hypothetical protein
MERGDAGAATAGQPSPAGGAMRVETGALEVRRHYPLQVLLGLLGWVLAVVLIVYLASDAGEISVRIAIFLATVAVVVAVTLALVGGEVRPRHLRERAREQAPITVAYSHDALGRRVDVAGAREPGGELTIEDDGGVRRYRTVGAVTE